MNAALALARRWVVDYFNRHDASAAREFCTADYTLRIGDTLFAGRDGEWLPAVDQQMQAFPGLGMTVHRTLTGEGWAAVWFSEHGANKGRAAVWSGVGIYREVDGMLTGCVAQEDYLTRRRQLKSGLVDTVDAPAPAPWDREVMPREPGAEAATLRWLQGDWPREPSGVACDDDHITGVSLHFRAQTTDVVELVSSGMEVAFSVRQRGTYLGGLPEVDGTRDEQFLDVNGLVTVVNGTVTGGRVIRDRMGLKTRLVTAA